MKKPLLTFFCLLLCGGLSANGPSRELPAAQSDAVETPATWDKIRAHLPKISGFLQAGYQYSDTSSEFFVKRARLSLTGDIVPKFDYKIQFEFAKPRLVDAYLQYRPFPQFGLRAGQFKIPFSLENTEYGVSAFEFIDYPLALSRLMAFDEVCGLAASGRDIGAACSGGFFQRNGYSVVRYDLAVFNGEGINTRDRNKSKDFVARLIVQPLAGFVVSGSYYRGEYGSSHFLRERYGAGVCYDRGPFVVRGEWFGGTTGSSEGPFDSGGWYAMAGWRAPRNLTLTARFDSFVLDCARRSSTRQNNYTAGLLWSPVKYLRCQFNYTYEDYGRFYDISGRHVATVLFTGIF
ncbi:porin [Alistipes muris]|uniref:porin n=1 Tax=Alistipes muris TaxID=2941326 RepID=UPI00203D0D27|nr:porin [Alistipes muris]MCX4282150.1 porin [Alistipes sp.]